MANNLIGGIDGQYINKVNHKLKSGLITITKAGFNNMIAYSHLGIGIDLFFLFADIGYGVGLNPFMSTGANQKVICFN